MLPLNTAPPAQGTLPTDAAVLPASQAGFNQPQQTANTATFVLEGQALLAAGEALPAEVDAAAAAPAVLEASVDDSHLAEPTDALSPLPVDPSVQQELNAEQWLLSILGQRTLTVQARDGDSSQGATQPQTAAPATGVAQVALSPPQVALDTPEASGVTPLPATHKDADSDALTALLAVLGSSSTPAAPAAGVAEASTQAISALGASSVATTTSSLTPDTPQAQAPTLERHLTLEAPQAKWGEQMLVALRDNVDLQLQQKVQSATIRLDPPELGSLEIMLSHEAGRLSVQISASNGDVARLLNSTSERLRQELVGQNFLQVNVQVSADGGSSQQGQQQARQRLPLEDPIFAAAPLAEQTQRQGKRGDDVLVTV